MDIQTGETTAIYKGPAAPLTSICFSADDSVVFAGCWDETIWSWGVISRKTEHRYQGHTDFVKAVVCPKVRERSYLVSGGADADIIVWNTSNAERLYVFKGYNRGILDLAVDPISQDGDVANATIFTSGSDRDIRYFSLPPSGEQNLSDPIQEHETSVYKLFFDADGDLWTASADKTVKCLCRENGWKANMTLDHPDFVRDVLVHEQAGWVITACRDEEVRIWNRAVSSFPSVSNHGF
jgi:WD40 repeat protein